MLLLIIFNMANWAMAAYGIVELAKDGGDFASFLLAIFIMNLLLYTSFYILMKLRYGERITRQPAVYILLSWVGMVEFSIFQKLVAFLLVKLGRSYVLLLE